VRSTTQPPSSDRQTSTDSVPGTLRSTTTSTTVPGTFTLALLIRSENIRHNRERAELEREHREVMERADRVLRETRRAQKSVTDPQRDRQTIN